MGDSGEGYECIVDISCMDASGEFWDDPGTGEEKKEEDKNIVSDAFEGVISFFKNWLSFGE